MKKLQAKHLFQLSKIIKAGNLKEELGNILEQNQKGEISTERLGIEMFMSIISACGDDRVEQLIYKLLDDVFEADTKEMSLEALLCHFKQLAKENNLLGFFRQLNL